MCYYTAHSNVQIHKGVSCIVVQINEQCHSISYTLVIQARQLLAISQQPCLFRTPNYLL